MKQHKLKLLLFLAIVLAGAPTMTEASSAIQVADDTILFTIDFVIDDSLFVNQVPIAAEFGVAHNDRVDVLGYAIEGAQESELKLDEVNALVLSDAMIHNNRYEVPIDTPTKFTLFILATFTEPLVENTYGARITKLPYFLDGRRTTVHQDQLDELDKPTLKVTE